MLVMLWQGSRYIVPADFDIPISLTVTEIQWFMNKCIGVVFIETAFNIFNLRKKFYSTIEKIALL